MSALGELVEVGAESHSVIADRVDPRAEATQSVHRFDPTTRGRGLGVVLLVRVVLPFEQPDASQCEPPNEVRTVPAGRAEGEG